MDDPRYPYTYAADFIRVATVEPDALGCLLSRSQAGRIRKEIARAIGMTDAALAELLATQYQQDNADAER